MKCVRNNQTGEVKRVSDERAKELTKKDWVFIPKTEWKADPETTWVKNSPTVKE